MKRLPFTGEDFAVACVIALTIIAALSVAVWAVTA